MGAFPSHQSAGFCPSCVIKDCEASRTSQLGQQPSQLWLPLAFHGPCVSGHCIGKQWTQTNSCCWKKTKTKQCRNLFWRRGMRQNSSLHEVKKKKNPTHILHSQASHMCLALLYTVFSITSSQDTAHQAHESAWRSWYTLSLECTSSVTLCPLPQKVWDQPHCDVTR